jgi:Rod binding domain-containing protein
MFRISPDSPLPIHQPIQQLKIDKDRYLNIEKENSFEETLKIEEDKLISPSIENQKKVLREKSEELESLLVLQMLKVMKPKMSEGLFGGGHAEEIWTGMLYEEYANQISQTADLGLATQIYEELSSNL